MFQAQPTGNGMPDIKSAIGVLRQRLGNPYNKPRPPMGGGAGPQGIDPSAVVNRGGQQGIMGRGGNFQALGAAASRRLGQSGAISNSGEIQGSGGMASSGPIMATKPAPMPPGGLGGMNLDGSSGRKPWQGGGVQQPPQMPPDFNPDVMKQAFERMTPEQQRAATISISGFPAPPNQTADPSGGRGFVPPGAGAQGQEAVGGDMQALTRGPALQPPGAQPGMPTGGFMPPSVGGGAPGLPPDIMAQINALRGGGGANYRGLMTQALGNQLAY